jgi:hypothetical protein
LQTNHLKGLFTMYFTKLILSVALLAGLSACGGGSTPGAAANGLVCSNPSAEVTAPENAIISLFATVYQLELGTIDPVQGFIQSSVAIFKLAADNSADIDGNKVIISSACYQASTKQLTLDLGKSDKLVLSSGGKAIGSINGKIARSKAAP